MLDHVANPNGLPVGKMTVAYSGSEVEVPLPAGWREIEVDLLQRIEAADQSVSGSPSARPAETCSMRSVRHMCEAYWNSDHVAVNVGSFGDAEVKIASRAWSNELESEVHANGRGSTSANTIRGCLV